MFLICLPNIPHDYINVLSNDFNIIIDKVKACFINNYYFYIVECNLTSAVSFSVNSYNGEKHFITKYLNDYNYNMILIYKYTYDAGIATIFHKDHNHIIALIKDEIINLNYSNRTLVAL